MSSYILVHVYVDLVTCIYVVEEGYVYLRVVLGHTRLPGHGHLQLVSIHVMEDVLGHLYLDTCMWTWTKKWVELKHIASYQCKGKDELHYLQECGIFSMAIYTLLQEMCQSLVSNRRNVSLLQS